MAQRTGQATLKITIQNGEREIRIALEGRVAGPWVAEFRRVWLETAPWLGNRALSIDLQNVIYVDLPGKKLLRMIYSQTRARLVAGSPWAQYLAEEIMQFQPQAC